MLFGAVGSVLGAGAGTALGLQFAASGLAAATLGAVGAALVCGGLFTATLRLGAPALLRQLLGIGRRVPA